MHLVATKKAPNNEQKKLSSNSIILTGHSGEVFAAKFSPDGTILATAGMDAKIFLWNVFGDCVNFETFTGHKNAILDLEWSADGLYLISASVDGSVCIWDVGLACRVKKIRAHYEPVNCIAITPTGSGSQIIASGSNDGKIKFWSLQTFQLLHTIDETSPVLALSFSKDSKLLFSGSLDNTIKCWDISTFKKEYELTGHTDSVTGLSMAPDGTMMQSVAMDGKMMLWDIKPFVPYGLSRNLVAFDNIPNGFEKNLIRGSWSSNGDFIAIGGADKLVRIFDISAQRLIFQLPGHKGCVNQVSWHPQELILASAGSDGLVFIGQIDPLWLEPDTKSGDMSD